MIVSKILSLWGKQPKANILFNGEMLEAFTLESERSQVYMLFPLVLNIMLEVLVNVIKQEKIIIGIIIRKEEGKLFLDDKIIHINSQNS